MKREEKGVWVKLERFFHGGCILCEQGRVVQYQGDGSAVGTPTDLPFAPPGLMWRGQPAITFSQLTSQLDAIIASTIGRGRGRGH